MEGGKKETVILTFDDGLENQHTVALPILEEYGFKASIFVGQWIGGIYPDAPAHCITKEQLISFHEKGFDIGNHTMSHPPMEKCDRERLLAEFSGVEELLVSLGLPRPVTAAYPGGPTTPQAEVFLRERGYLAARCVEPRALRPGQEDPFALPAYSVTCGKLHLFDEAMAALSPQSPVILVYHGLPSLHYPPCGIEPGDFIKQMEILHKRDVRCISLKQYMLENS